MVTVRIRYKTEWYAKVKLFGIPIYDLLSDKEASNKEASNKEVSDDAELKKKKKPKKEKTMSADMKSDIMKLDKNASDKNNQNETLFEQKHIETAGDFEHGDDKKENKETEYKKTENKKNKNVVRNVIKKINEFLKAVIRGMHNLLQKIRQINKSVLKKKELAEYYIRLFEAESTKRALEKLKKQLGRLLKHIKPSKFLVNVLIGSKDPYLIGQAYSVYGTFYQLIGNHVFITPDFEEDRLEGDLFLKGRITVAVLLFIAWKVVFDKEIKRLYKRVLREEM